jgi:hypothetical protein
MIRRFTFPKQNAFKPVIGNYNYSLIRTYSTSDIEQKKEKLDKVKQYRVNYLIDKKFNETVESLEKLYNDKLATECPVRALNEHMFYYKNGNYIANSLHKPGKKLTQKEKEEIKEEEKRIYEEMNLKNYSDLEKKCQYYHNRRMNIMIHNERIGETEDELEQLIRLDDDFFFWNSEYDKKIAELLFQKMGIDREINKYYRYRRGIFPM